MSERQSPPRPPQAQQSSQSPPPRPTEGKPVPGSEKPSAASPPQKKPEPRGSYPTPPEQKPWPEPEPTREPCPEPEPEPEPCPEPEPEPDPCDELETKPCRPPKEDPCPPEPICPDSPEREADPCSPKPGDGNGAENGEGGEDGTCADGNGGKDRDEAKRPTPAAQLEALRKERDDGQKKLQELEPLKTRVTDLDQRIQALEKTVDGEDATWQAYRDFYRTIEESRSAHRTYIDRLRCQLNPSEERKDCIKAAIAAVQQKVDKAIADSKAQKVAVKAKEKELEQRQKDLEWAKKWYEFFKSDLQKQATAQNDELKKLKGLAESAVAKNQCEAWFYLDEMDYVLESGRDPAKKDTSEACYQPDLTLGTFLTCWPPGCYQLRYEDWIVAFNEAERAEKIAKSELETARKHATELEKTAKDHQTKRRDWILKDVKKCCDPDAKCAPDTSSSTNGAAKNDAQ